jgi:predicted Ser/Thr protein kinase
MMVIRKLWKIAWDIWQHRNHQEHCDDKQKEWERIQQEVQLEIQKGNEGIVDTAFMFMEDEIEKVKDGHMAYAKAWLRNLKARKRFTQRHSEGSSEIQQMRNLMRRFLNMGQG